MYERQPVSHDEDVNFDDSSSQNVQFNDSGSPLEGASPKMSVLTSNVAATPQNAFVPKYTSEWLTLLSTNGFLDGQYSTRVFETEFEARSVVIWTSWLCPSFITSSTQSRGLIIGRALFEACFTSNKDINIADLVKHLEEISDTFIALLEEEENTREKYTKDNNLQGKVKTSELKEQIGSNEGAGLSKVKVMELCFALVEGMVRGIKEDMKSLTSPELRYEL